MKTYVFRTSLFRARNISRNIEIKESASLYRLAEAIVGAYGFDFDHCFGFFSTVGEQYFDSERQYELFADLEDKGSESTGAKSVKKTKISSVWMNSGDKMLFLFDYGDQWLFVAELIGFDAAKSKTKYPRTTNKIGQAPEQYPELEE